MAAAINVLEQLKTQTSFVVRQEERSGGSTYQGGGGEAEGAETFSERRTTLS